MNGSVVDAMVVAESCSSQGGARMAAQGTPNYVYFVDQQLGLGATGNVYLGRHKVTIRRWYIAFCTSVCLCVCLSGQGLLPLCRTFICVQCTAEERLVVYGAESVGTENAHSRLKRGIFGSFVYFSFILLSVFSESGLYCWNTWHFTRPWPIDRMITS